MIKRWGLQFLLLTVFVKQLAWMTFLPLWQTPDEQAHFGQVAVIAETGKNFIPTKNLNKEIYLAEEILGTLRNNAGDNKYTYHPEYNIEYSSDLFGPREKEIMAYPQSYRQDYLLNEATAYPPLYYRLSALIYKLFYSGSLFDRVFAVRIFTSLTMVALTGVAYLIGKKIFTGNIFPLVLATLVGFMPMASFVHAGVSSDPLFNLIFAVFLYFCLRLIDRGLNVLDLAFTVLILWLLFLTKPQVNIMLFILAPLLMILLIKALRERAGKKRVLWVLAIVTMILFAAQGIINRFINGASFFPETERLKTINFAPAVVWEHLRFTLLHTYREVLPWYWGVFRWLSLGLPDILRKITNWLTMLSFVGFGWYTIQIIRKRQLTKQFWMIIFCVFALGVYFLALTAFDFGFRQAHSFSFGIQGRYFFPVLIPQMMIFLVGLTALTPTRFRETAGKLLAIGMIVFNVIVFFWVTGSYYQLSFPQFFYEASQYKPVWLKWPINIFILLGNLVLETAMIIWLSRGKRHRQNSTNGFLEELSV